MDFHRFPSCRRLNRLVGKKQGCVDPTLSEENLLTVTTKPFKQKYEASENVSEKSKDRGGKTKRSLNPSDLRICVFLLGFFWVFQTFLSVTCQDTG